ncbi:hypothetical protein [Clostridium sp.]|uniref:hypothetical protein n=1 Tax=Clostridium sp. TaxID=1506 RepID=UPI003F2EB2B1
MGADNVLSNVVAIIVAVVIMFGYPILDNFQRIDDISQVVVLSETTEFVDSVRALGYITREMYTEFNGQLTATGNVYRIQMEHYRKKYDPIYDESNVFQGSYETNYQYIHNDDILQKLTDDGVYYFSQEDMFNVKVHNINKTVATRLQDMIYKGNFKTEKIIVNYGGMIRNENN